MYGKYFASTFTGSMFGAGCEVFALWGYIIAMAVDGTVELNPSYLSAVLGATPEQVGAALRVLCNPDPQSRTPTAQGARLIHENGFTYTVVNHGIYRAIRNEEERRAYNRDAKRKERAQIPTKTGRSRVAPSVIDKSPLSNLSAHTEAEAEAEADPSVVPIGRKAPKPTAPSALEISFLAFWLAYPKKVGKAAAFKAWKKINPVNGLCERIHATIIRQQQSEQWRKDNGQFIPNPATWLNQGRWDDEPVSIGQPRSPGPAYQPYVRFKDRP
jgi:hypothetical protein